MFLGAVTIDSPFDRLHLSFMRTVYSTALIFLNKGRNYAYDKHIWLIDEEEAKRIRLMFKLAEQGKTLKEISSALQEYETIQGTEDIWTESKVRYRLRNEVYKGDILTGKTFSPDILSKKRIKNSGQSSQFYIEDHHEPIVERELFDRVQRILERKRK